MQFFVVAVVVELTLSTTTSGNEVHEDVGRMVDTPMLGLQLQNLVAVFPVESV